MEDGFSIAVGLINVPFGFERLAIIGVVVDLAVISDVQRGVFIRHRLMAAGDIYDTETAMAQPNVAVDKDSLVIGASVRDNVAHGLQDSARDFPSRSA